MSGELIFDGEYNNGERIRGKEYDDILIYEGEYINGKRK